MKIEIDLNDILGDEYGAETIQESVRRQVTQHLTETVAKDIKRTITERTNEVLQTELQSAVKEKMPSLIDDLLNSEYKPTDSYGSTSKSTTLRNELIRVLSASMVYKKTSYSCQKNEFTSAVDAVIKENLSEFQKYFNSKVDDGFKAEALKYATQSILLKLGVPTGSAAR